MDVNNGVHISEMALSGFSVQDDVYVFSQYDELSYTENGHEKSVEIEDRSFWYLHRNRIIYQVITNYHVEWVLDVGGGTGFVSLNLQKKGVTSVLLEPALQGAMIAKKRGVNYVLCGKLEDVDFKLNSLPSISLFDVLEHIQNDKELLAYCFTRLKVGGRLFITVPAYQSLWSNFDVSVGHKRRYSLKLISSLLNSVGFDIVYKSYFFSLLFPLAQIRRRILNRIEQGDEKVKQDQHRVNRPFIRYVLLAILNLEVFIVRKKKRIPWGTSCMLVAIKRGTNQD